MFVLLAIQTGCPNTPAHKSPYCKLHKPTVSIQSRENNSGASGTKPIGLIIAKKGNKEDNFVSGTACRIMKLFLL